MNFWKIKKSIKNILNNKGLMIQKAQTIGVREFIQRFRDHYVSTDLIRVGAYNDGGYLLPNILTDVSYCFSPGVSFTSDFELDLSNNYNIKSYMADASVSGPAVDNKNFSFLKKYLGAVKSDDYITLSDWIENSLQNYDNNLLLQMDIEGAEYEVLIYESPQTMAKFKCMIIEFHNLDKIFDKNFLDMISAVFEKIYLNFSICHAHPNNCSPLRILGNINVPPVLEVTFIRNDLLPELSKHESISLPHKLDRKNLVNQPDVKLPEEWWK